jgi:hypothetical protein
MRIKKYSILVFFAFFLTGCASANERLLRSLTYSDGCTSACWVGIEVGKTSFDQAQKILVDRYTIEKLFMPLDNIIIWMPNEVDSSHGTVTFSQGIVDGVQLSFESRKFAASDAIKVFGEPSDVMISIDLTKPNHKCTGMQLSYSETGTEVLLDTAPIFKGVEKSQSVIGFWFRSPEDLRNMQLDVQNYGTSMIVEWQGYKDYCEAISQ